MNILQKEQSSSRVRIIKRILGRILLDGGFISGQDLEKAVERQKQINSQLGEILVQMGVLKAGDLTAVLSIQKDLSTLENAIKIGAGVQDLLGELLIKAKRITKQHLDHALQEQQRTGEKLGEVLVRLKVLTEQERDVALEFQRHQRGELPGLEKLRLGEILVTTGQITRAQLEDALRRQKLSKKKIGELLIAAGYVKADQVEHALKLQQKLVAAAIIAAVSLSSTVAVEEAHAGTPVLSTKRNITAIVREHATMELLSQVNELVVTNADISRGYVEAPAASRINVKTNNPAGCLLAFEMMDNPGALFNAIYVRVGGREVHLSSGSGWVQQPYMKGGMVQEVSYRFALSKNAQPGTYNWPLTISVLPLGEH